MIKEVPPALAKDIWPAIKGKLAEALEVHPFLSLDDLLFLILNHRACLIVDFDDKVRCAAVMEVVQYPSLKVANVVALGGETGYLSTGLNSLLDYCEQWAKERNCDYFAMIGRPGWSNFIPSRGGKVLKQVQGYKLLEIPCQVAAVGAM